MTKMITRAVAGLGLMAAVTTAGAQTTVSVSFQNPHVLVAAGNGGAFKGVVDGVNTTLYCFDLERSFNPNLTYSYQRFTFTEAVNQNVAGIFPGVLAGGNEWRALNYLTDFYPNNSGGAFTPAEVQNVMWNISGNNPVLTANENILLADALNPANNAAFDGMFVYINTTLWTNYQTGGPLNVGTQSFISRNPEFVVVPEPATFAMLAVGMLGLAAVSRRRNA